MNICSREYNITLLLDCQVRICGKSCSAGNISFISVAYASRRTVGTTAAARSFALFLIDNQTADSPCHYRQKNEYDNDISDIFHKKFEHCISLRSKSDHKNFKTYLAINQYINLMCHTLVSGVTGRCVRKPSAVYRALFKNNLNSALY